MLSFKVRATVTYLIQIYYVFTHTVPISSHRNVTFASYPLEDLLKVE
jgi:hypothetical protein